MSVAAATIERSDEALVARLAEGDAAALAELYDRHARAAYGLAFRVLRDAGLAEDAVQEGFLCAWRLAASFDPSRARASTWLITFVHRRAVDLVRHNERRRWEPLGEHVPEPAAPEATEDDVWARLERRRVQAALRELSPPQRELLELAYYGGLTQAEIAQRLGEPLGTVKSRTFAALARLRDLLQEPGQLPAAAASGDRELCACA